jgi:hypothetical protein
MQHEDRESVEYLATKSSKFLRGVSEPTSGALVLLLTHGSPPSIASSHLVSCVFSTCSMSLTLYSPACIVFTDGWTKRNLHNKSQEIFVTAHYKNIIEMYHIPLSYWHSCHSHSTFILCKRIIFSGTIQQASENDIFWQKAELHGIIGTFDVHFSVLTSS